LKESDTEEVRKTIIINASPEIAFRALTDETELTQWFSNERTVLEPQVGGAWMLKNCRSNNNNNTGEIHTMRGKILEIVQDKKLSYTWNVDEYPDIPETIVTWMIEPLDGGGSRSELMLVHSDLANNNDFDDADRIWSYFIGRLAEHCKDKQQQSSSDIGH
jgi:uncharacterized protein YndB with AHSA1/START domain